MTSKVLECVQRLHTKYSLTFTFSKRCFYEFVDNTNPLYARRVINQDNEGRKTTGNKIQTIIETSYLDETIIYRNSIP